MCTSPHVLETNQYGNDLQRVNDTLTNLVGLNDPSGREAAAQATPPVIIRPAVTAHRFTHPEHQTLHQSRAAPWAAAVLRNRPSSVRTGFSGYLSVMAGNLTVRRTDDVRCSPGPSPVNAELQFHLCCLSCSRFNDGVVTSREDAVRSALFMPDAQWTLPTSRTPRWVLSTHTSGEAG